MKTPDKDRKAAQRRRFSLLGLKRLEVWAHEDDMCVIKKLAATLRTKRTK
mgnify:CR=1 FL=1